MMVVDLEPTVAVLVDIAAWTVLGVLVGWLHHRLPAERLRVDGWLTRPRRWEEDGAPYDRLRIRWWKDLLPEAGATFRGGVSKRSLPGRDRGGIERLVIETRRAERVHWTLLASSACFLVWNPPALTFVMVVYAIVANVPFIAVQRFNRARLLRTLERFDRLERRRDARGRSGRSRERRARGRPRSRWPRPGRPDQKRDLPPLVMPSSAPMAGLGIISPRSR